MTVNVSPQIIIKYRALLRIAVPGKSIPLLHKLQVGVDKTAPPIQVTPSPHRYGPASLVSHTYTDAHTSGDVSRILKEISRYIVEGDGE